MGFVTARGYRAAKTRAASARTARCETQTGVHHEIRSCRHPPDGPGEASLPRRPNPSLQPTQHTSICFTETVALEVLTASVGSVGYSDDNERLNSYFGNVPPEEYEAHYYAGRTGPSADDDTNTTAAKKPGRWSPS